VHFEDDYAVSKAKIYINGVLTDYVSDEKFYIPTDSVNSYIIKAEAVDEAGNRTIQEEKITIAQGFTDNTPPEVSITFDKDIYVEGDTVTATVIATDDVGVAGIDTFINDEPISMDSENRVIIENLTLEPHTLTAIAYDAAGNARRVSYTLIIDETDRSAPGISVRADKSLLDVGESLDIMITITDDKSLPENCTVTVTANGTEIPYASGIAVFTPEEIGEYTMIVTAEDEAGNKSDASFVITAAVLDREAPTFSITPDKNAYFVGDDIILTIASSDNIGVVKTELEIDDVSVNLTGDNTYTITDTTEKTYIIKATVYDAANNYAVGTLEIPVNAVAAVDTEPPTVSITTDKDVYYVGEDIIITVTATDNFGVTETQFEIDDNTAILNADNTYTISNAEQKTYIIKAAAYDAAGNTRTATLTIPVNAVAIPDPEPGESTESGLSISIPSNVVEYGESETVTITITDDIDRETVKAYINSTETQISQNLTFEFEGTELFDNEVSASAIASNGETLSVKLNILVADTVCPEATVLFDKEAYNDGEDINAVITATDNYAVAKIECDFDGTKIEVDDDGKITIPDNRLGEYLMTVVVSDVFGNTYTLQYRFYVETTGSSIVDVTDGEEPNDPENPDPENPAENIEVSIEGLTDGQTVTKPTPIIGTVGGEDFEKYTLEYANNADNVWHTFKESTEPVTSGELGVFDPTLLENGTYTVRVVGHTEDITATYDMFVTVEGNMKIGNFSIAFQDMDISTIGLPLTVIRSYDSRVRDRQGDFGYGWDLSTAGATLTESSVMGINWKEQAVSGIIPMKRLVETRPHIVTINWGDGRVEKFRAVIDPAGNLPITSAPKVSITFKGENTNSKLEAVGQSADLLYNSNKLLDSQLYPADFTKYKLTKADGTVYIIGKNSGVESITDSLGNVLTFTKDGIVGSQGDALTYNRDSEGRITRITAANAQQTSYVYDENGDLVSMTDVSGETVQFTYDNHYLTEIIDARGITVSRNIYDDDGRLIKTIDANGDEITYSHDINGREEIITDRMGYATRYIYDDYGNVISETDPMGNTTLSTFDTNGYLKTQTDAMGNVTNYSYDSYGNLLSMTNAAGATVTNGYDTKGQIVSVNAMGISALTAVYDNRGLLTSTTDAMGNDIDYDYNSNGKLTSVTDEIGTYMNMTYDADGNVVSATNGIGTTATFTYDSKGNCISKTTTYDGMKSVTEYYSYDSAGNITQITDSDGNITTTDYDSVGNITSATDSLGNTTNYTYDILGNLTGISYPDGTSESFTYDRNGNNLTATDRMGRMVSMTYDKVGNLLSKTYPNGARVTYTYNANYQLVSETSATGADTYYSYDSVGRTTAITDALGNSTRYSYNSYSQLDSMTDPNGSIYRYEYDLNGNRTRTIYPDGSSVSSAYDARGRVTSQTDQHGYTTTYSYDNDDRLTAVTNAMGGRTSYTYDGIGNITSVTDANGNITRYEYDTQGRLIKTTNALGYSSSISYNSNGDISSTTDYAGNVTTYEYDNFGRLIYTLDNDGRIGYNYRSDGLLTSVTDESGTTTFTYNEMDGLIGKTNPDGSFVNYSYDNAGRLTEISTSYGETRYEYDILDRLVRVIDRNGYATVYEYDANGNRTAVHYANGVTVSYEYDVLNRLTRETAVDSNFNIITSYSYTLGAAGERLSVTEPDSCTIYSYDELYRLTSETITKSQGLFGIENTDVYSYTYDAVGNRLTKTFNGDVTQYSYNALNQLTSEHKPFYTTTEVIVSQDYETQDTELVDNDETAQEPEIDDNPTVDEEPTFDEETQKPETTEETEPETETVVTTTWGTVTYEYDPNGNLIRIISPESSALYTYNSRGQLTEVIVQSGINVTHETYTYDYAGNRISKTTDSEHTKYLLDTNGSLTQVIAELDLYGNVKAYYTRGDELISQDREGEISYYIYDGHGNVRFLTNASGHVTDSYDYDAFGNLLNRTGDTENNYLYCGEQFDSTTGLYYLRARYMNPSTGTFISMDSYQGSAYDPVSLHKYLYANANPVMYSDPSGYMALTLTQLAVLSFATVAGGFALVNLFNSLKDGLQSSVGNRAISNENTLILTSAIASNSTVNYSAEVANSLVINETLSIIPSAEQAAQIQQFTTTAAIKFGYAPEWAKEREKANEDYGHKYEIHHIVPKGVPQASPSRIILAQLGINLFAENYKTAYNNADLMTLNLVRIKTITHKALHSNNEAYCEIVNIHISTAYNSSWTKTAKEKKFAVEVRLITLRMEILAIDEMII
jgi:RHS repeat-associated protein